MTKTARSPEDVIFALTLCAVPVIVALHLFIGSSIYLVVVLGVISIMGAAYIKAMPLCFSSYYVYSTSLYLGGGALLTKLVIWQPLQDNLVSPVESANVALLAFVSILCAGAVSLRFSDPWRRAPFFFSRYTDSDLTRIVAPITVIGFIFQLLHIALRPQLDNDNSAQGEGFGGFGALYPVLLLGVCIQVKLLRGPSRADVSRLYAITAVAVVVLALMGNVKKLIFDFAFVSALSAYAFGVRPNWVRLMPTAVLASVLIAYMSPLIHLTRNDFKDRDLVGRISLTLSVLSDHSYSLSGLKDAESEYMAGFGYSYRPYFSFLYPSTMNAERFSLIFPIDQTLRDGGESSSDTSLMHFIGLGLKAAAPSFLASKVAYTGADLIAWTYGFRDAGSIARPVIGFPANAVAVGGWLGALWVPLVILLPIFGLVDAVFGELKNNMACVVVIATLSQCAELVIDVLVNIVVRQLPLIMLLFISIAFFLRRGVTSLQR